MKRSWSLNPNAGLIWDLTAEVEQEENDDESLHDKPLAGSENYEAG